MTPEDFEPTCPGHLTPTSFREEGPDGAYRDVPGWGFVPADLPPNLDEEALLVSIHHGIVQAERALSLLEGAASQMGNPALLANTLMQREARLSSAIENTFASAEEMALFNSDPASVSAQKREEVREVNNYFRALKHGFDSDLPICTRLILEMHEILLGGVQRKAGRPGHFRTAQNAIGRHGDAFSEARFVPPPASVVPDLIANWETYVNQESVVPRLARFAIAHYQFETIHPFDDGNGRIGRLLAALQLCEQAQLSKPFVYLSGYFEQHRSEYYEMLYRVSTKGQWFEWLSFFINAVRCQAEDTSERARRLTSLRTEFYKRVGEKRASALLHQVVDLLFWHPSLTAARIQEATGVTPTSAGSHLRKLVDNEIIIEVTGRRSHRIFVAPEILAIIDS